MNEQVSLDFTTPPAHRQRDHATSIAAAQDVKVRAGSQRAQLLQAYYGFSYAITDEEAAEAAGLLASEYSKRCGELRAGGYIAVSCDDDGNERTRAGSRGIQRILSYITTQGVATVEELLA